MNKTKAMSDIRSGDQPTAINLIVHSAENILIIQNWYDI